MAAVVYEVGDIVTLKKAHPCGSKEWEILRVGADFRLKCKGCGHQIMVARKLVEKNTRDLKKIEKNLKKKYYSSFYNDVLISCLLNINNKTNVNFILKYSCCF